MPTPASFPISGADYRDSLTELTHAIEWNQGNFSLILAHCNSLDLRQRVLWDLGRNDRFSLQTITLPPDAELMFSSISSRLRSQQGRPEVAPLAGDRPGAMGDAQYSAIAIAGFETVTHIDTLLSSADAVRDELRKVFHCPLVWWMNDSALVKLIRLAPNIHSWFTFVEFANVVNFPEVTGGDRREPAIAPCLNEHRLPLSDLRSPRPTATI
ncbi:MAG: hypothetical protein ACFB9N_13565 [Geitlerinemataceae cyanobacterium]